MRASGEWGSRSLPQSSQFCRSSSIRENLAAVEGSDGRYDLRRRALESEDYDRLVPELPAGTVTFVFTDIEDSTELLKRLGDDYREVLTGHRRIVRDTFAARGGVEMDTQGDAFFFVFARAREAVAAAVDAQRAHAAAEWPAGVTVRVRIGLHTGEPAIHEEGYVGLDVVRAARMGRRLLLVRVHAGEDGAHDAVVRVERLMRHAGPGCRRSQEDAAEQGEGRPAPTRHRRTPMAVDSTLARRRDARSGRPDDLVRAFYEQPVFVPQSRHV
jgi:hypothetical protein